MQKDPNIILEQYWGFKSFIGSQKNIIDTILSDRDVLALMPAGGGKSLCFQIPALAKEGICIVVSPLIALIHNQVEALKEKVLHEHQIDTYKQLITFLDGPAVADFIESINNDIFKAEVLALHKQFDKIILMLEKNINSNKN